MRSAPPALVALLVGCVRTTSRATFVAIAPRALVALLVGCGGTVVFEDVDASSGGGGAASSQPGATTAASSSASASTGAGGDGGGPSGASSSGSGGAPPDGSCVAPDYCSCVATPTCQVVAEDCFCSCEEPCSDPCDCRCGGGAFLQCAPGSIRDPGALDVGVWLVGWSGGLNHFSWLRFDPDGALAVFDGANIVGNAPYFPCSGSGSWSFDEAPETVRLALPAGCPAAILTFGDWHPIGMLVPGAQQEAYLFDVGAGVTIGAWRFADEACSSDLASCVDPFAG